MKTLSVISMVRSLAFRPDRCRQPTTSSTNREPSTWTADTFTLRRSPARDGNCCCQMRTWRHACSRIHTPMPLMRPLSSATGMNSSGGTRPLSGCCQRTRASTPFISPVVSDTMGW